MLMVSACLLGINCKYNGGNNFSPEVINKLQKSPFVAVCPEVLGGLGVPRPPCEIQGGDGRDVIMGQARVVNNQAEDVTEHFIKGALLCLELAKQNHITQALLKGRSPSCGSGRIYDGSFSSGLKDGDGVTAALFKQHGIRVITEEELDRL